MCISENLIPFGLLFVVQAKEQVFLLVGQVCLVVAAGGHRERPATSLSAQVVAFDALPWEINQWPGASNDLLVWRKRLETVGAVY